MFELAETIIIGLFKELSFIDPVPDLIENSVQTALAKGLLMYAGIVLFNVIL
jgi:hypothetical protein